VLNAFHGVIHPEMYDAELFKPIAKKLVGAGWPGFHFRCRRILSIDIEA
jgi:hypothetical protein